MPEMKGRSLEELDEIFAARTSTRKFKQFQCTIREEAAFDMTERTGIRVDKEGMVSEQVEDREREAV
jgi:hypothetical protein